MLKIVNIIILVSKAEFLVICIRARRMRRVGVSLSSSGPTTKPYSNVLTGTFPLVSH